MPVVKKTFDEIYAQMEADARQRIPALSDFQEGSVVRSLLESFSAELAILYEQMDAVYQSGFVDTASGPDLDRVVAVLGLVRNEPDFATGTVTFSRDPGSNVDVTIPIGTLVTTEEKPDQDPAKKSYLTTEVATMTAGQTSMDVRIQADAAGRQMTSEANTVIVMPRPVPGIKSVTNPNPVRFLGRDRETDDELRRRAKQVLLASGRASTTSIENALLGMPGVRDVHVTESFPDEGQLPSGDKQYGKIQVYVDGLTNENSAVIRARVDEVRASGVYAVLKPAVAKNLEAVIQIDVNPKISGDERAKLEESVRDAVINLVDSLGMGAPLLFSQLSAAILKVNGVNDVTQFAMSTFTEIDTNASGTVTLHRGASNTALKVPQDIVIQTADGKQFRLTAEAQFAEKVDHVDVAVQAVATGLAGEMLRTGTATNWNALKVGDTSISITNDQPIQLARTSYQISDRKIPVDVLERLSPWRVRVASEPKPFKVRVQVRLADPTDRDKKAAAVKNAVAKFFQGLPPSGPGFFTKSDLGSKLDALSLGSYELRLVAFAFQSGTPQDEYRVDWSFIETPQPEIVFVYSDALKLAGTMRLVLSLTADAAAKNGAIASARQGIADYLDSVGPEKDIDLAQVQQIAASTPGVLRVEFKPEECTLLDAKGAAIDGRVQDTRVSVKPFEKVFLSEEKFVIQA